jgi:hypothetical protein
MLLYIGVLFLVQLVISIESRMIVNLNNCTIVDAPVIRQIRIISFAGYAAAAVCALIHPFSSFIIILILTAAEIIVMCRYDGRVTAKIKKRRAEQKTENNQAE